MPTIKAGVQRATISPEKGMYLIGFVDRAGGAKGVHDDLTATALVLDDGNEKAVIVSLDLLMAHPETVGRIKAGIEEKLGIPGRNVLLCCSHTHSGPVGWAPSEITLAERARELKNRILSLPAGFVQLKTEYDEAIKAAEEEGKRVTAAGRARLFVKTALRAPKAFAQPKGISTIRRYLDNLVETVVGCVVSAAGDMAESTVAHARGTVGIGINRRERKEDGTIELGYYKEGPVDPDVDVLRISQNGKPLVTIVNHACHVTILGPNSCVVSADMIGVMRAKVENELGGLCMFMQGACGDINPNVGWTDDNMPDVRRFGGEFAAAVLEAARNFREVAAAPIKGAEDTVDAYLEVPEDMRSRPVEEIYRHMISRNFGVPLFLIAPLLYIRFPWKGTMREVSDGCVTPIDVGALRFGDVAIGWISMEAFVEIGRAAKDASPAPVTLFAGYTNGHNGYLPTAEEKKLGGYEVERVPYVMRLPGILRADTEAKVVDRFRSLFEDVSPDKG